MFQQTLRQLVYNNGIRYNSSLPYHKVTNSYSIVFKNKIKKRFDLLFANNGNHLELESLKE